MILHFLLVSRWLSVLVVTECRGSSAQVTDVVSLYSVDVTFI